MKTQKACRIELAASQDKTRSAICEPFLDVTNAKGTLVATDGRMLAMLPVEIETADDAGYVSAAVLKEARKQAARDGTTYAELSASAKLPNGATMPRTETQAGEKYPNWRQVVPAKHDAPVVEIALDAWRLWQLAQAMGTQCVRISVLAADRPFLVYPVSGGKYSDADRPANMDASGVLMPVILQAKA